jgi:teichuronic acid biosynthesis glycosyltransferase TuaG
LTSVLLQSYQPIEVIIIDDHSIDSTFYLIDKLKAYFLKANILLKYKYLNKNSGPSIARNTGINMASGDFIAFLVNLFF